MLEAFHPEKGPFLKSLRPGERIIGFFTLRSKQLESFRDPTRGVFLTLILSDRSGQLLARAWDNAESLFEALPQGQVIKVDGEVEVYQERAQIIIKRARLATPDEFDPRDMVRGSLRDPEEMTAELRAYIEKIRNPHLRELVEFVFGQPQVLARFQQAPAARRIHHAYKGGLLEHTLEVLTLCNSVISLYPKLDSDLLVTGALLHDIGKTREYGWDLDIDFTDEGRLLGHIVIGDEMITAALQNLPDFPAELALRLRHMLIAHHGRKEWGSPQPPKTMEALALHHVENLTAQINRFHLLLEERPADTPWTQFDPRLGRQLYGGPLGKGDV